MENNFTGYQRNPKLKNIGVPIEWTPERIEEYKKCINDPVYFAENYVKIISLDKGLIQFDPYNFQKDLIQTLEDNRFVITKAPRQSGKSTIYISYLLHYILFNENVNVAILAHKAKTAKEILRRLKLAFENLPSWLQQGVVSWNITSIEIENGSRVSCDSTAGDSARGESYNLVLLDEFAFVKSTVAEDFFTSVYPTISSGESTKLFIVSTPNGLNHFHKIWKKAVEKRNEFVAFDVSWKDVPGRDEKWLERERRNLGEQKFRQEVLVEFVGSSNTLIAADKLEALVDSEPIESTDEGLKIFEGPKEDSVYVSVLDPSEGVGGDYAVLNIIDVTKIPYKQVAIWRNNETSILELPSKVKNLCEIYNNCYVLVETNVVGTEVCHSLYYDYEYENILKSKRKAFEKPKISIDHDAKFGVKTTASIKSIGCSSFKQFIENDTVLVQDEDAIEEMKKFVKKGSSYEAQDHGDHDDIVMTFILFSWLANQEFFKEISNTDILNRRKNVDEDSQHVPAGFSTENLSENYEKDEVFGWIVKSS